MKAAPLPYFHFMMVAAHPICEDIESSDTYKLIMGDYRHHNYELQQAHSPVLQVCRQIQRSVNAGIFHL